MEMRSLYVCMLSSLWTFLFILGKDLKRWKHLTVTSWLEAINYMQGKTVYLEAGSEKVHACRLCLFSSRNFQTTEENYPAFYFTGASARVTPNPSTWQRFSLAKDQLSFLRCLLVSTSFRILLFFSGRPIFPSLHLRKSNFLKNGWVLGVCLQELQFIPFGVFPFQFIAILFE